ncbi:glycosyltransferase [Marinibacterium sp. SX1]|uniref:glycosyltransferase n=1 Tax=Marinibacterium sp. SX1 TaxID=3388424 RepID=UPI003D1659AD
MGQSDSPEMMRRAAWTDRPGEPANANANAAGSAGTPRREAGGLSAPGINRRARPRVALIHYWLVGMRGGEKVLEALCRMFPEAEIFTHVYAPEKVSPLIRSHKVHTTSIARLPLATRLYTKYVSQMPRALEELDLSGFDLVISSESGPAKGVIPQPEALHLCYVHSPMRYIWDHYGIYRRNADPITRRMMAPLTSQLRLADVVSAARVDGFAANSRFVQQRVMKYWRRPSRVIHPPVDVARFHPAPDTEVGSFYLYAGELTAYKRPDLAIEAFNRLGLPLVVIGGPSRAEHALARKAGPNIRFLGRVSDDKLRRYFAACRALVFPGEEDFGILPVEVMAAGRPVIAYGKGGVLDSVIEGETGLFFDEQSAEALVEAVEAFEAHHLHALDNRRIIAHAQRFDEAHFRAGMAGFLADHGMAVDLPEARIGARPDARTATATAAGSRPVTGNVTGQITGQITGQATVPGTLPGTEQDTGLGTRPGGRTAGATDGRTGGTTDGREGAPDSPGHSGRGGSDTGGQGGGHGDSHDGRRDSGPTITRGPAPLRHTG